MFRLSLMPPRQRRLLSLLLASGAFLTITVLLRESGGGNFLLNDKVDDKSPSNSRTSTSVEVLLDPKRTIDVRDLGGERSSDSLFGRFSGGDLQCFLPGVDAARTKEDGGAGCVCLPGYHGADCGVPDAVWAVEENRARHFVRRQGQEATRRWT